jgi:hypothetical protein
MQLTGQTSTHDLSFTPMQGSAMMNGMDVLHGWPEFGPLEPGPQEQHAV